MAACRSGGWVTEPREIQEPCASEESVVPGADFREEIEASPDYVLIPKPFTPDELLRGVSRALA